MKKIIFSMLLVSIVNLHIYANLHIKNRPDPIDTIRLNEVVVTATRNPVVRKLGPALVDVLPHNLFGKVQSCCVAQGLNFVPGIRVENNCQNCGWTEARINGLDGHYSQILIDSRPLFSALSNVYGLEQLPANMIERIEVIRGGGSALFGPSSIGGTINIITKEPTRNEACLEHTLTKFDEKDVYENNTMMNASAVSSNGKSGLYLFGSNRYRQPYDADGDGFSELNKIKTKSVGVRMFLEPKNTLRLSLNYYGINDYRRGGNDFHLQPHEADIAETTQHEINAAGIDMLLGKRDSNNQLNVYYSFQNTDRNSYYGADKNPNNYGLTHNFTSVAGMQYTHSFKRLLMMPSYFVLGMEYNSDKINDESVAYKVFTNQTTYDRGVFFQNEWRNKIWSLLLGGRIDKHNLIDRAIFSPRMNIRYMPDDSWNFRFGLSGGFRAPQAYDEDLHVDLVNGNRRVVRLAEDLREESSTSCTASVDYNHRFGSLIADFVIETFYTDLRHSFAMRELAVKTDNGDEIDERYNASGARVYGSNVEMQLSWTDRVDCRAGFTVQRSRYKELQEWSDDKTVPAVKKMFRTPNTYGYFVLSIQPLRKLMLDVAGDYTGSMLVQHREGSGVAKDVAVDTPRFFDFKIKGTYEIPLCDKSIRMRISVGVNNLFNSFQKDFDKGKERDSNYIYGPMIPRTYSTSICFVL